MWCTSICYGYLRMSGTLNRTKSFLRNWTTKRRAYLRRTTTDVRTEYMCSSHTGLQSTQRFIDIAADATQPNSKIAERCSVTIRRTRLSLDHKAQEKSNLIAPQASAHTEDTTN